MRKKRKAAAETYMTINESLQGSSRPKTDEGEEVKAE